MHTRSTRTTITFIIAGALVALTGCGSDEGRDTGTLTDEEYLGHQLREVTADDAPALELDIGVDDHGGWNLHIDADDFEFTPEEVNGDAVGGHGHAHVYVDDAKFARVYSEHYYLPASAVPEGEHTVMITLNADDHSVWAVAGEAITASASVTGTADDGHAHSHGEDTENMENMNEGDDAGGSSDADEGTADADHVFTYTIADGVADPQLEQQRVEQGATARIEVTSDVADTVHLHGYEEMADVSAGGTAVIEFTADRTGRFELETHEGGLILLDLLVE